VVHAVFLAFEKCVGLREDLAKGDKKAQLEAAQRALLEYGEPPGDDDELAMALGGLGGLHGASMSHGATWDPAGVTGSIYRALFPAAGERARVLFAGWTPPERSRGAAASPGGPMSMDASMFGLGGGGGGRVDALGDDVGGGVAKAAAVPRRKRAGGGGGDEAGSDDLGPGRRRR